MNTLRREIGKRVPLLVLILPCIIVLAVLMGYPIYQTFRYSFSSVKLPSMDLEFIGLQNFREIFGRNETFTVFKNTLVWVVGTVSLKFLLGFWAALVFNTNIKGGMFLRVLCLLPWVIPSIVGSNLWKWMLHSDMGLVNAMFDWIGAEGLAHNWFGDPHTALYAVIVAAVWSGFPFAMLIILAGIQGIPKELYEAAEIDGANKLLSFRFITIPSLKSIIFMVILMELIFNLNAFDYLYILTGGGPAGASEILGLFIHRIGFVALNFGGASSISVAMIICTFLFFIGYWLVNYMDLKRGVKK